MAHKTQQGTWRVRWQCHDGRRLSKCFKTKIKALQFEVKRSETPNAFEPSKMTFAEFSEKWLTDYAKAKLSPGSAKEFQAIIAKHFVPAFGSVPLRSLTESHLASLQTALLNREKVLKPKTMNTIISVAKTMMVTAVKKKLLSLSPFEDVELLRVGEQGFDFWRPEERDYFARMARQHDPELVPAVIVACHTGLRRAELAALRRYHLDFERRQIEVADAYCYKTKQFLGRTKGFTRAFIPMNDDCYRELKDKTLLAPDALIFGPALMQHASMKIARLCKKIGARKIRMHDTRHSFASCLVMGGVPLYTAQKLLRHTSSKMSERYAHMEPGYLAEAVQVLSRNTRPDSAPISICALQGSKI